jgi:c-di-AMP phosphodiesterase-like protein
MSDKRKLEIVNHIQEITSDVNIATRNNLINSPIPLLLIETDGIIIWKSKSFIETFKNIDVITYLNPIIKEIKLNIEKENDENNQIFDTNKYITKQFNIENKFYKIYCGVSKSKKKDKRKQREYQLTLYFIDDTKYNELFDQYNNSKTCVGIAMIDNYEEVLQRVAPEERAELVTNVEKIILDWAKETGGLIVKTDRDRFIYIFEQQYLSNIEKEKVNVLDKVKMSSENSSIRVTLSIAISNEGENNLEKYKSALAGMDVVLGRGGDQAVIRKDGKYKFYGGNTMEQEKRTKVKARTVAGSIANIIKESSNVVIMGHKNIDIDAIGSGLGMYRLSKTLGKDAYIVSEPKGKSLGKFIDVLNSNEEYKDVIINAEEAEDIINQNTLLIIVDTHKIDYVEFPELLDKIEKKIVIDHHRKSPENITDVLVSFHEVYASSAAELVTEIIQYATDDVKLTLIEAESLYGGIMVDTKDFTFKTGVRTFEAAAYLRKFGVDIIRVKKWFQADLESYNVIADIVKKLEITNDTIAISVYDNEEDENANLICAKAADELLTISNITASFVIGKIGEKVFISGRSIGDINVQIILEKLGGGGHITLAGAQIEGLTLEEAKNELIIRINEYFTEIE